MPTQTNNALTDELNAFFARYKGQELNTKFLQKFSNELLQKISRVLPTKQTTQNSGTLTEDIKNAYYSLVDDQKYITKYKKFVSKVFNIPVISTALPDTTNIRPELNIEKENINNIVSRQPKQTIVDTQNKLPNIATEQPKQTNLVADTEEGRANLIKEQPEILLDGFTDTGKKEIKDVFSLILENAFKSALSKQPKLDATKKGETTQGGGLFSGLSDAFGAIKTAAPLLAKVAGPVAAIAGGEIIGGQIGKAIGSNEAISEFLYGSKTAGKEAYETYGTGITGLARSLYALYEQGVENKNSEDRRQEITQDAIKRSGESLKGKTEYSQEKESKLLSQINQLRENQQKLKVEYEQAQKGAMEGWNPFHDDQRETTARQNLESLETSIVYAQNRLAELRKLKPQEQTPAQTTPQDQLPKSMKTGGIIPPGYPNDTYPALLSSGETVLPAIDSAATSSDPPIPLNNIFNNTIDNSTLDKIVSNTGDTNNSLKILSEALFKLVTVFDKKPSQNNTTIINSQGQSTQQATPASVIANTNADPIRKIRMQFA